MIIVFLGTLQFYSLIVNLGSYLYGIMPEVSQFVVSVLCILVWAGIGVYYGYKKDRRYVIGASIFWLGEITFLLIGFLLLNGKVAPLTTCSIYGLRYIIPLPHNTWLMIILNLIAYLLAVLSFGIGYLLKNKKIKSTETKA